MKDPVPTFFVAKTNKQGLPSALFFSKKRGRQGVIRPILQQKQGYTAVKLSLFLKKQGHLSGLTTPLSSQKQSLIPLFNLKTKGRGSYTSTHVLLLFSMKQAP